VVSVTYIKVFFLVFLFVFREELKEKKERERNRKIKRYALIGLATVGGGTLIGMSFED